MPDQQKLDRVRLRAARDLAGLSNCTRRKVGAILVNADNKVIGEGYNGVSSGELHCDEGGCPRGKHFRVEDWSVREYRCGCGHPSWPCPDSAIPGEGYNQFPCKAIHAEHNAILLAGAERARGGTIYITHEPCTQCSVLIKHVGIERVVVDEGL